MRNDLNRIWIRSDQKRLIKLKAVDEDKTIPEVMDDLLGGFNTGLDKYDRKLKNDFRKIL